MSLMMLGCSRPSLIATGGGAVGFVQSTSGNVTTSSTNFAASAFSSNVTSGNAIFVACAWQESAKSATVPTDSQSNTYVAIGNSGSKQVDATSGMAMQCFVAYNVTGGASLVVTGHLDTASGFSKKIIAIEMDGADLAAAFDQWAGGNPSSASPTAGPITPSSNNNLLIGVAFNTEGSGRTFAAVAPWTETATASAAAYELQAQYYEQATAASISSEWTKDTGGRSLVQVFSFIA